MLKYSIALIAGLALFASCGSNDITNPNQISFPDSNVSYAAHVRPFLDVTCNFTNCHDNSARYPLTSWVNLRSIYVVDANHDTNSNLVQVVESRLFTHAMFTPNVGLAQQKGIRKWVVEGAKNN